MPEFSSSLCSKLLNFIQARERFDNLFSTADKSRVIFEIEMNSHSQKGDKYEYV